MKLVYGLLHRQQKYTRLFMAYGFSSLLSTYSRFNALFSACQPWAILFIFCLPSFKGLDIQVFASYINLLCIKLLYICSYLSSIMVLSLVVKTEWIWFLQIIEKGPIRDSLGRPLMTMTNSSNPWWSLFETAISDAGGKLSRPEILASTTDARFMRQLGIPVLGFSPMTNTPILLHDHNEVILVSIVISLSFLSMFLPVFRCILTWCVVTLAVLEGCCLLKRHKGLWVHNQLFEFLWRGCIPISAYMDEMNTVVS